MGDVGFYPGDIKPEELREPDPEQQARFTAQVDREISDAKLLLGKGFLMTSVYRSRMLDGAIRDAIEQAGLSGDVRSFLEAQRQRLLDAIQRISDAVREIERKAREAGQGSSGAATSA